MLTLRNDITKVKEINVELIKSSLKHLGTATKAQIAEDTDISVATCGKILNELCETGEVLEAEITSGGYGRPAKSYFYNGNYSVVACIYAENEKQKAHLSVVVSNLLGEIIKEVSSDVSDVTYELLEDNISELMGRYPNLRAVAIGIPGFITDDAVELCDFVSLMGIPLQSRLQEKFPPLQIVVENDMNAAAYGFYRNSCWGQNTTIGFIYSPINPLTEAEIKMKGRESVKGNNLLNYGINFGAGFVSGGKILRGATGFSGEVAFLPMTNLTGEKPHEVTEEMMAYIIGSIVPILNPQVIALTGVYFDIEQIDEMRGRCLRLISSQHMPEIIMRNDIHEDYVDGLLSLALEALSCGIALIERQV